MRQLIGTAVQGSVVPAAAVPDQCCCLRAGRRVALKRRNIGLRLVVPRNGRYRSLDQRPPLLRRQDGHIPYQHGRVGRKVTRDVPYAFGQQ